MLESIQGRQGTSSQPNDSGFYPSTEAANHHPVGMIEAHVVLVLDNGQFLMAGLGIGLDNRNSHQCSVKSPG
jgi:hypothetical protein